MPNGCDDEPLDLRRRDPANCAGLALPFLQKGLRDIVTVTHALLVGMARAHPVAAIVVEKAHQERRRLRSECPARDGFLLEPLLHGFEQPSIDNRRVFAGVNLAAIGDLANVEAVLQEVGQRPDQEVGWLNRGAVWTDPGPRPDASTVKIDDQQADRTQCEITAEDAANLLGLLLDD